VLGRDARLHGDGMLGAALSDPPPEALDGLLMCELHHCPYSATRLTRRE
jgi:hypothetical protein